MQGEDTIFKVANRNVIFYILDELIACTMYLHIRHSFGHALVRSCESQLSVDTVDSASVLFCRSRLT